MLAQDVSVRRSLAEVTASIHLELHSHTWISCLARDDLKVETYAKVLGAYRAFFAGIEMQRQKLRSFQGLSLAPQIKALDKDLLALGHTKGVPIAEHNLGRADVPLAILGALYVLHGAGFGGKTLNSNVRKNLPAAPRHYLALGTPRTVWRDLIEELEQSHADKHEQDLLFESATQTFFRFGQHVTMFCEDVSQYYRGGPVANTHRSRTP